jgi:RND family efflux transporter MFP subunit
MNSDQNSSNGNVVSVAPGPATPESLAVTPTAAAPAHAHPIEEHVIPPNLKRPHTLTVAGVLVLFVLLIAGLFFLGWGPHEQEKALAISDARSEAITVPVVSVAAPTESQSKTPLVLPCDIKAYQETALYTRANGFLKKLNVDIHDQVKAGEVLAEIDTPDVDAQLAQSEASVNQEKASVVKAQADVDLAQRTLDRYQAVQKAGNGNVTQQELDQQRTAVDQAKAAITQADSNVVAAQANVQRLKVLQSFEKIVAPFDGVVTTRNYDVGALLSPTDNAPGKELFRIAETDKLRVYVNVPQVYATQIAIGAPATLRVRNYGERDFVGKVARTSSSIDLATRMMSFELEFANPDGALFPGMYGEAHLVVTDPHPVLRIPTSAMMFDATGPHVALVQDGKIHFQPIVPGRDLGTELEVVSGITSADRIVSSPGEQLTEGGAVQVVEPHAVPTQTPRRVASSG